MSRRYRNGSARGWLLLAAVVSTGFALPRVAAAAQDPSPTPGAGPITPGSKTESTNSAGTPTPPWRDVYVDITQLQEMQLRYGQFKMPFSLDENTGSQDLDFAYRSGAATLLAPGRARGWMVHGDTLDRFVGYEYGVFRTDGSNAIVHTSEKRVNAGETTVWRVTIEPLRGLSSRLADVHIGYARTGGDLPEGISGIKGRAVLGADFYKPEFLVFGRRERRG